LDGDVIVKDLEMVRFNIDMTFKDCNKANQERKFGKEVYVRENIHKR